MERLIAGLWLHFIRTSLRHFYGFHRPWNYQGIILFLFFNKLINIITDLGLIITFFLYFLQKDELIGYVLRFLAFVGAKESTQGAVLIRNEYHCIQWFTEKFFDSCCLGADVTTLTKQISGVYYVLH